MIQIVAKKIELEEVKRLAHAMFGNLVKAVVDVERGIMAIGGELHADEESELLKQGSMQNNLWGINLYPDQPKENFIEYDSVINLRPSQGNLSRGVDNEEMQKKIKDVVFRLVNI